MCGEQDLRDVPRHLRIRKPVLRRPCVAADDVEGLDVGAEFGPDVIAVSSC